MTLNLSEAKNHDCRHHPRGSVRRASGFVLTGQQEVMPRMDSQRRVPEVGFWEAYAERRWDSAQTIASRTCLPNRSLQGSNRSRAASGAVSSVHRNAHRERTWIR